jgi:hypothetical protein
VHPVVKRRRISSTIGMHGAKVIIREPGDMGIVCLFPNCSLIKRPCRNAEHSTNAGSPQSHYIDDDKTGKKRIERIF